MAVGGIEWQRARPQVDLPATRSIAAWATDHFGLVTTRKLADLGISSDELTTLRDRGWLLPTRHRGVHLVGHAAHVPGRREAVELAGAGAWAALTGRSGSAWRRLTGPYDGPVELLVDDGRHRLVGGVRRIRPGVREPTSVVRGLRCAGVLRTLIDLAASSQVPAEVVREALVEALRRGCDLEPLHAMCHGRRGSAGPARGCRSSSGTQAGLTGEGRCRRWHESRFREDRARDRRRLREGLLPFRFAWHDVVGDEAAVVDDVTSALRADGAL